MGAKRIFERSQAGPRRFSISRVAAMSSMVSEVCARYSESLLKRRLWPSQAKLRSTIHVSPAILKVRCRRFKICNFQPSSRMSSRASLWPWWPASAVTVRILGNRGAQSAFELFHFFTFPEKRPKFGPERRPSFPPHTGQGSGRPETMSALSACQMAYSSQENVILSRQDF